MFSWVGVQSTILLLKNLICSSSQEKHYIRTCTVQSERPTRGRERRAAVHNLTLQSDRDLRIRNLQRRDNTWPTRGDKRSSNAAKTPDGCWSYLGEGEQSHLQERGCHSGFWQLSLSPESRPLTTFITPVGRYHFNKLPFGISSAPELFQRRMSAILEALEGVVCLIDDVLVIGKDEA